MSLFAAVRFGRLPGKYSAPTIGRAAMANIFGQLGFGRFGLGLIVIIVTQLDSRLDILDRVDKYLVLLQNRLAVRIAGVIDISRGVPLGIAVDTNLVVYLK